MTPVQQLVSALKSRDYHAANQAFASAMQSKLADRLAQERKNIYNEDWSEESRKAAAEARKKHAQTVKSARKEIRKSGDSTHSFNKGYRDSIKKHGRPASLRKESVDKLPTSEVQRVFDEIGNVSETEILCNVRDLKINSKGEVVSFVHESVITEADTNFIPRVQMSDVKSLVDYLNDRAAAAHERRVDYHMAHEQPYGWEAGKSKDEIKAQLMSINKREVVAKDRAKYIAIDVSGSGVFMVDKTDGRIYGIKGYGQVHKGHTYGTLANPDKRGMLMKVVGSWDARHIVESKGR